MTVFDPLGSTIFGTPRALAALDLFAKATALMALAFACHAALGRRRALARSALWNATLVGLLLLPASVLAAPRIRFVGLYEPAVGLAAADLPRPFPPAIPPATGENVTPIHSDPVAPAGIDLTAGPPVGRVVPDPLPQPRLLFGGIDLAFGLYLAVAAFLGARLINSLLAVARLRRRCRPVEDRVWSEAVDRWRARLGIARRVPLLVSPGVTVPVVVGWLRPAVILPEALAGGANAGLIDAVVLHELGHVRRGDFGWNVVRVLVRAVYWPHPLTWLVSRVVGEVREQACDDVCVLALGGPAGYRAALIEVASGLARRPEVSMGLAMARGTSLGRRLAWIDRSRGASRCLLRWPARLAALAAVGAVAGLIGSLEWADATAKAAEAPSTAATLADDPPAAARPDAIEITVLAKDSGEPIPGATISRSIDLVSSTSNADREGRLRIDLSKRRFQDTFSFDVWADGYVQQRHFFAQNDARYPKIPEKFTVELLPGEETLGGKVTDEQGKAIAGVKVDIWGYLGEKKQKDELAYMVDATTDDRGQWRSRSFRKMKFAYLYLRHPDFLSDDAMHPRRHGRPQASQTAQADETPLEALREFSDVQVMARGSEVSGDVRDEGGEPIPGAEVGWLEARSHDTFHGDVAKTTTDAGGRFRFAHARPGKLVLQVKAAGHAPGLTAVEAKDGAAPVAIRLGPARTLTGRVVGSDGEPVPDAFVVVDSWRGYRSLGVSLKSDADGRFRWSDAPPDSILMNVNKAGYRGDFQKRVSPDEEALLTLRRSTSVTGWVRDATTKKAIETVRVELGTSDSRTGGFAWKSDPGVNVSQGLLGADIDAGRAPEFRLRFHAKGYETLESRSFHRDEPQVKYDVTMTPTDEPQGVVMAGFVRRPDGTPLAGAAVAITYPMTARLPTVRIQNGSLKADPAMLTTKTDASGRFSLAREPDPAGQYAALVVIHPEFYAEVARPVFEADPTIKAEPWGRVEGVLRVGSKPGAGESVGYFADRLGNPDVPRVSDQGEAKTDEGGRFVLERVVPGDVRVSRQYGEPSSKPRGWSNGILVEVKPGETARVEVGGKGRPVVAKISPPPGFDPKGDYAANSEFEIQSDRPNIPYPSDLLAKRDGSMIAWAKNWWASAEGHGYRGKFFRFGQAMLQPDGTLRAEDVPPGEYRLTLTYSGDPFRYSDPERIARATRQFTIPEIPGGRSDEPFDLGELRPRPARTLKVGAAAPPIDVETLDGRRVRLEDFRGKYVLVDFWATWCGPCLAEIPDLKAAHDRFGKDERFAMLSLSLDAEKDAPRKFVAEKGLAWSQGFLGDQPEGGVQEAYHVEAIPSMFLISPDGTLKAAGLRGNTIAAAIAEALKP